MSSLICMSPWAQMFATLLPYVRAKYFGLQKMRIPHKKAALSVLLLVLATVTLLLSGVQQERTERESEIVLQLRPVSGLHLKTGRSHNAVGHRNNPRDKPKAGNRTPTIADKLYTCATTLNMSSKHFRMDIIVRDAQQFLSHLSPFLPKSFNATYKNPCWWWGEGYDGSLLRMEEDLVKMGRQTGMVKRAVKPLAQLLENTSGPQLQCLPYFFILGFAKSGTSSLYTALMRLAKTAIPKIKEPSFWIRYTTPVLNDENFLKLTFVRYLENFRKASEKIKRDIDAITCDSSAFTAVSPLIVDNYQDLCTTAILVSTINPASRLIFLMRNPVDRLYSHYVFTCGLTYGKFSNATWPKFMVERPAENFHTEIEASISYFNSCLKSSKSLMECVNVNRYKYMGSGYCGKVGVRLTESLYYGHIAKWLPFFPRDQFLFLKTEDLSSKSYKVISQATEFLSLPSIHEQEASRLFATRRNVGTSLPAMLPKTRAMLEDFYRPYNEMLAEITGDRNFLWEDDS